MRLSNKRARFEYEFTGEGIEAGLSLKGAEAKSIREGRGDMSQAFVKILGNEAFLVNANIPAQGMAKYDSTRSRKLLLHKKEILSLVTKMKQKKLQIVPVRVYNKGRLIKLYLSLASPRASLRKRRQLSASDIKEISKQSLKTLGI